MRLGLGLGVNSITSQKIGAGFTGILDEYSGAAAAYSVRRLSSTYTDGLIRVRRSSDDAEQDIGFDANGDLDTTALTTFVGSQNLADWSENFGNFNLPSNVTLTPGVSDPFGGTDATDLTATSDAWLLRDSLSQIQSGTQYTVSIYARAKTAGVKNGFRFILGTVSSSNIEATTTWTRYTATITANGTACGLARTSPNSFAEIEIYGFQINEGTSAQSYATTSGTYLEGNGAVTTFYDQSGNGNNATNSTESEQPLVVSGGTLVEENGKAAIQFDNSDDNLNTSFVIGSTTDFSAFTVVNIKDLSSLKYIWDARDGSTDGITIFADPFVGNPAIRARLNSTTLTKYPLVSNTQYLLSTLTNSTEFIFSINGDTPLSGASSAINTTTNLRIGRASYASSGVMNGNFSELIIFNSDQSTNRTGIETNINDHFDIYT